MPGQRVENSPRVGSFASISFSFGIFVRGAVQTVRDGADTPRGDRPAGASLPTYLLFDRVADPDRFFVTGRVRRFNISHAIYPRTMRQDALPDDLRAALLASGIFGTSPEIFPNIATMSVYQESNDPRPIGVAELPTPPPRYATNWQPPNPRWVVRAFETTGRDGDRNRTCTAWLDDWPTWAGI